MGKGRTRLIGTTAVGGVGGIGTVTSVGLGLPAIFTVSGSPVTTAGTLTGTLATQVANTVFSGPTTGADATPTFRAVVLADIPTAALGSGADGTKYLRDDRTFQTVTSSSGEWYQLISAVPVTSGKVFSNTHVGAGSGMKYVDGMGVMASVDGDAVWALVYKVPQSLPAGTRKLDMIAFANATSGAAKVNVKWASAALAEDWSSLTLNAEGTSTLTWAAGGADKATSLQVTLDADTHVAGEYLIMNVTFETSSWTLAQVSTWKAAII